MARVHRRGDRKQHDERISVFHRTGTGGLTGRLDLTTIDRPPGVVTADCNRDEPESSTQSSVALAINNRGLVVGQTSDQNMFVATEWTWAGEIAAQLTTNSTAIDINDHGVAVVTTFAPTTGVFESMVWVPDLGVFELPRLSGSTGAPLASEINNHNQVVGQIESGGGLNYHLVVWNVRVHGKS